MGSRAQLIFLRVCIGVLEGRIPFFLCGSGVDVNSGVLSDNSFLSLAVLYEV